MSLLSNIAQGYLKRQQEETDRERQEKAARNKSLLTSAATFWTKALEGAREDPDVQQALLGKLSKAYTLDPATAKEKDIKDVWDASILAQGVTPSPGSMKPQSRTERLTVGGRGGLPPQELAAEIPAPTPPEGYRRSVYPSRQELQTEAQAIEEAKAFRDQQRALGLHRGKAEIDAEFAAPPIPAPPAPFTLSPGQQRFGPEGELIAQIPAAEQGETDVNMQREVVTYKGKPTDVLIHPRTGRIYLPQKEGLLDITGETSYFRPPPQQVTVGGLPNQTMDAAQRLAAQFDANPVVRQYNEAVLRADNVQQILNSKWTGPGDMALVFEFMRALDPTSVVRESEYTEAARTGNIFAGAMARFNGLLNPEGGFLSDQVKQDFNKVLQSKIASATRQFRTIYNDFGRRIDNLTGRAGTGKDFLTDYTAAFGNQPSAPPIPAPGDGTASGMIRVTVGGRTGEIPASQWEAFKAKNPTATRQ